MRNKNSKSDIINALMNSPYYEQGYKQGTVDVLNKIRAEIEEIHLIGYAEVGGKREIASRAVLQIIDKYKAESEEEK